MNMEKSLRANLLAAAGAYARHTGKSLQTIASDAHGDSRFFDKIKKREGSFTVRKYDEVMRWFESHAPAGMKWPAFGLMAHPEFSPKAAKERPVKARKPARKAAKKRKKSKPR